jgi:hypothetical protein
VPAAWALPRAIVWRPQAAALAQVGRMPDRAHVSAEAVAGQRAETLLVRPFQAARAAARLALPVASAQQAAALPPGEPVARGVVGEAVPLRAAGHAAGAPQAEQDAEEVPQQVAGARVAAAGPQQAAEARDGVAEPQPEAAVQAGVEEAVRPRAAPGAQAALPSVPLSAGPWAFHRGQAPPSPAPQPAARSVHAMEDLRIARPSARSWQAAKDEVWS